MIHSFTKNEIFTFINLLNYPVVVIDANNFPIYINKKFKIIEQIEKSQIQEKLIYSLTHNEYHIVLNEKQLYFNTNRSHIEIDNIDFTLISLFDISVRKKMLKDISAKQDLFNQLTEQLPQSVILFDERIIYINKTFEKLTGYTEKSLLKFSFINLLHLQDQELFKDVLEKLSLGRKTQIETSLKIVKKNKEIIWIRLNIKRIKQNEKYLFLAVISDISKEIKELDEL